MSEDLGDGKATSDEMLSPEQRTAMETEGEQSAERTRESEIKANVDFWKNLGVEVDEADVRREIEAIPEVKGFDWYLFVPQSIENSKLLEIAEKQLKMKVDIDSRGLKNVDETNGSRRDSGPYAIASRCEQNADDDSFTREFAIQWEAKRDEHLQFVDFMKPTERIVAGMRWRAEHEESDMDERGATMCPDARTDTSNIPVFTGMMKNHGLLEKDLLVDGIDPFMTQMSSFGVRRVVAKEIPVHEESEE